MKAIFFFLLLSLGVTPSVFAFKVDTHVWLAQEIIDDLAADRKLSINLDGRTVLVSPPADYVDAILSFQDEFRAGAIGPDATPDILIGQMLVHPGVSGWGTDKWLKYLLANAKYPNEKAFVLGYLIHASSDTFAHSYVNMYSGGVFDLMEDGVENEKRHFLLESYLSQFTPGLSTRKSAYQVVKLPALMDSYNYEYDQAVAACRQDARDGLNFSSCMNFFNQMWHENPKVDFVQRSFFYDSANVVTSVRQNDGKVPEIIQQYKQSGIGGGHIATAYELRRKLEELIQSNTLHQMDLFLTKEIVYYWTNYMPSGKEAEKLNEWHQKVKALEHSSSETVQSITNQIEDFVDKSSLKAHKEILSSVYSLEHNINKLSVIPDAVISLKYRISEIERELSTLACKLDPLLGLTGVCKKIDSLKKEKNAKEAEIQRKISEFISSRTVVASALEDITDFTYKVHMVRRNIDNTAQDLAQVLMMDVNPIRALLKNWASGIDSAMDSYRFVGLDMMKESMRPGGLPMKPLEKWAFTDCNLHKLLGAGKDLAVSSCNLVRSAESLHNELQNIKPFLASGGLIHFADMQRAINDIINTEKQRLKDSLTDKLFDVALSHINPSLKRFLDVLKKPVTDETLNAEFQDNEDAYEYLEMADIAARVRTEMRLTTVGCNGKSLCFDKQSFPVIANAIQLSKLALLNKTGAGQLASSAGLSANFLSAESNILFGALNSIDGDHQWYGSVTPPYPTKYAAQIPNWQTTNYGYSQPGLTLWKDTSAREKLFKKIFIGPLNEGLFTPKSLGNFSDLLPLNYRKSYNTCKTVPFPNGKGNACTADPDLPVSSPTKPLISQWSLSSICRYGELSLNFSIQSTNAYRYEIQMLNGANWSSIYSGTNKTGQLYTMQKGTFSFRAKAGDNSQWSEYVMRTHTLSTCSYDGIIP